MAQTPKLENNKMNLYMITYEVKSEYNGLKLKAVMKIYDWVQPPTFSFINNFEADTKRNLNEKAEDGVEYTEVMVLAMSKLYDTE